MTYFFFYVILNDSEGSHRRTDRHILLTLVVGYFACAQYDVLFLLRHYERSEESHRRTDRHILLTLVVGYFAYAQYDVKAQVGYFACAQYDVLLLSFGVFKFQRIE